MKRKNKKNEYMIDASRLEGFPTRERMSKSNVKIRNNIALDEDPIRIDKLLRNGIIDEMQHLNGMQIITYWMIANRPFLRTASYEQRIGKIMPSFDYIQISRMSAEDKFYKTMALLSERDKALISKICFDEMAVIEAGRSIGLPINSITTYVRAAFDTLGNALSEMRKFKKNMEKETERAD